MNVTKKYELLHDDKIERDGVTLYRIRALRDIFWKVYAGDLAKRIVEWAHSKRVASCIANGRDDLLQYC